jgi:phosphopantothenoylcysteine decarboxylase/phosphopantothenate--cysteine ligase
MNDTSKPRILLGITGSIAAGKGLELARLLKAKGYPLRLVLSRAACAFVTPLSAQGLSGSPVFTELLDAGQEAAMNHIELARWADQILIAPASAHCIAKLANGLADDLLSTLCLASKAPLAIAPAMNQAMWSHPATQDNCTRLRQRGALIWGPAEGELACGDQGPGRMLEVEQLLAELIRQRARAGILNGLRVLISAGPTREAIDPVRFIGNRSSGRMGFAMAAAALAQGAEVTLVHGPCALTAPPGCQAVAVESALQMHRAIMPLAARHQIFIASAAVADYRVAEALPQKIKKSGKPLNLSLVPNPDILAEVAALATGRPFCVGFAAETDNLEQHARAKLQAKNLDLIIANQVAGEVGGFDDDRNAALLISSAQTRSYPLMPKTRLAAFLIEEIGQRYRSGGPPTA